MTFNVIFGSRLLHFWGRLPQFWSRYVWWNEALVTLRLNGLPEINKYLQLAPLWLNGLFHSTTERPAISRFDTLPFPICLGVGIEGDYGRWRSLLCCHHLWALWSRIQSYAVLDLFWQAIVTASPIQMCHSCIFLIALVLGYFSFFFKVLKSLPFYFLDIFTSCCVTPLHKTIFTSKYLFDNYWKNSSL